MTPERDPAALAEQQPANAWSSTIDFGDADLKKEFMLQCNFCHQQGGALLRRERSARRVAMPPFKRMVRYGARLSSEGQKKIPAMLEAHWKKIHANPCVGANRHALGCIPGQCNDPRNADWRQHVANARPAAAHQRHGVRGRQPAGPGL